MTFKFWALVTFVRFSNIPLQVWQLGSTAPNFTLNGHEKGVNCLDYYRGADKPYLISGADDFVAKIWDYQNKACVQTLVGHTQNVTCVCFHSDMPIIITGDGCDLFTQNVRFVEIELPFMRLVLLYIASNHSLN